MAQSLKERYEVKRLNDLRERLHVIDEQWDYTDALIIEAFDKQQVIQAGELFKKLNGVNFGSLGELTNAKKKVMSDISDIVGGKEGGGRFFKKIINALRSKETDNPLLDAGEFCEKLEEFFDTFPSLMQSQLNISQDEMKGDKTLAEIIAAKGGDVTNADKQSISGLRGSTTKPVKKSLNQLSNIIKKGLLPNRYIENPKDLAEQIASIKLSELSTITQAVKGALSGAAEIFKGMTAAQQAGQGQPTGGASGTAPATAGTGTSPSSPNTPGQQPPAPTGTNAQPKQTVNNVVAAAAKATNLGADEIKKVIDHLVSANVIDKDKFAPEPAATQKKAGRAARTNRPRRP